ncbi:MAG: DUF6442 family protein [Treponema sp.]|nr:DUF6442 family protein [Treponema sp.]
MTKDEILEKSRNENQNKDVYDLEIQNKAARVAYFSAPVLCVLVSVLQFIFTKTVSAGIWTVLFGMFAVTFLVKFLAMHKKHELLVFLCYLVIFVMLLTVYVFQLTGRI